MSDEPRVLLFMDAGRNRELLLETLGERYEVSTTTDVAALDSEFDCCLFDLGQFNRVAGTLQSKRDTSNAVFLPFVLLVDADAPDSTAVEAREYVDDVIEMPVRKAGLRSRVGNLVERRRTAAELARREAQLERTVADLKLKERAMDEAPVGVTISDSEREDNPIIYRNERFEALTGYSDVVGQNCRFLQGEETSEAARAELREAIDAERPVSVDILNYRRNGRKFWNRVDVAPVHDDDGTVTNYVGFQRDITERKIRERRLEVFNRVLSHNLRNKMNVIEGHVSLLAREFEDGAEPESLAAIESTARNLLGLADTIRDIEQVFSETSSTAPVALVDRVKGLLSAFEDRFPEATFDLTHPPEEPCPVAVTGFVAAIEEAVENAVKHNDSASPTVDVRISARSGEWVDVEVEDDGPGIPEQELTVLSSGESSLHHADRLGLWFMYWVVSRVGGSLSVSDAEPRGSTLTLSVPSHGE